MGTAEVMADRWRAGGRRGRRSFADKVRRLFDDPALHARLRAQASAKAADWSVEATTARLLELGGSCTAAPPVIATPPSSPFDHPRSAGTRRDVNRPSRQIPAPSK